MYPSSWLSLTRPCEDSPSWRHLLPLFYLISTSLLLSTRSFSLTRLATTVFQFPRLPSTHLPWIHSLYSDQHQLVWRHTGSSLSPLSPLCFLVTSEKRELLNLPAGLAPLCRFSWFAFPRTEAPKCARFVWTVIPGKTREESGRKQGREGKQERGSPLADCHWGWLKHTLPGDSGSQGRTGPWRHTLGGLSTYFLHRKLSVIPEHSPSRTASSLRCSVARKITALGRDLLLFTSALLPRQIFSKHLSSAALLGRRRWGHSPRGARLDAHCILMLILIMLSPGWATCGSPGPRHRQFPLKQVRFIHLNPPFFSTDFRCVSSVKTDS